jgi:hypothetical protein
VFDLVKEQLGETATQPSYDEDSIPSTTDQPYQESVSDTVKHEEPPNEVQEPPRADESIADA